MNILLVSPEFPDTFWSFKHALKFVHKRSVLPPLGLLTVATMLPESWGKRLVDLNVTRLKARDLEWADCVFLSAMIVQRDSSRRVIARCKEAGVKVVAGGPLFSAEHDKFPEVDHFVLNEAEVNLPPFLEDLERGEAKRLYDSHDFPELALTPPPAWELAQLKHYGSAGIQYSRGCPFNCDFCNVTALFGHRPRTKSVDQVMAELNTLYDAGWRDSVFFVDDNFIGNKTKLKKDLLPAIIEWRATHPGLTFHTEASINLADDDELMRLMALAGFDMVFIGIETPDENSLAECSKTQNRNRNLVEDVKRIQRAGLQVQGGFIVGFDSDAANIFERQIEFIQRSGIATAMVGLLQAIPGTRLFERLKGEGRLRGEVSGDNVDGGTNIVPVMNIDALSEGYRNILRHIYTPKHYYERLKTFLREYDPPRLKTKVRFRDLMAFVRSWYRLGIFGKERVHYWKLLLWTGVKRPRLFPVAVTLAIYGHHFRKTCELNALL